MERYSERRKERKKSWMNDERNNEWTDELKKRDNELKEGRMN